LKVSRLRLKMNPTISPDDRLGLLELLHATRFEFDRREIVGGRPHPRDILLAPVDLVGLEGLELDRIVSEILVADLVEVVCPTFTAGPCPNKSGLRS